MTDEITQYDLREDVELERRVSDALHSFHVPALRNVNVLVENGTVILRGRVHSFYARQIANHAGSCVAAGRAVVDEISLVSPSEFRDSLRLRRSAAVGVALLLLAVVAGCSRYTEPERVPVFPVTGQVTYQGKPAAGAFVTFHPKGSNLPQARAKADGQGKFALGTYEHSDGAPAGQFAVTVELLEVLKNGNELETGKNLLPPKYGSPQSTPIVAQVVEGPNTVPIKIIR